MPLAIAEGYATAATVHEAKGWPVAVAWDAGNLAPVGRVLLPLAAEVGATLAYCADDDHEAVDARGRPINPGGRRRRPRRRRPGAWCSCRSSGSRRGRATGTICRLPRGRPAVARQLVEQFAAATAERPARGGEERQPKRGLRAVL
ncbi:hypothetical protein LMH63_12730 [Spiribacter halobius]|uniref:hypothetical protein n=1 Tax=Sediminicurvatus halobius TaxID=2182432 RepID=UPI001E2BC013|nr:hypothetical protein [Spiribacter halobius]UEX76820.1 hypothetical protein LMH63_12730 [Spiribacter halobius]